ncbi:MAG: rod shape-determining protein MreC [Bryobacterales bacterium]|nr:rod shape-determining protein MreC [Bryobacterales bacterium]
MESLFYRYRNITVLLVAICSQMILLAWQIKGENNVPLVRVWAITAITPVASAIENARNGTTGFFGSYFALRDARAQARRARAEADRLRIENQLLRNELAGAQRTEALLGFQSRTPSRMVGARVIGTTTGSGARSILIDRGTSAGVQKGMAVVTATGIIGRVLAVYPFASQVMTTADPAFAAGVESQKSHVKGVMRGANKGQYKVDYVMGGQKLEPGEMFFTSGEDRVFPKGFPAGKVLSAQETSGFQEVLVQPAGSEATPEEVMVIVDPLHQEIPAAPPEPDTTPVFLAPDTPQPIAPPVDVSLPPGTAPATPKAGRGPMTQADRLLEQYRKIGEAQKFTFGEGGPGTPPPNFNLKLNPGATGGTGATAAPAQPKTGVPGATGTAPAAVPAPKPLAPRPPTATGPTGSTAPTGTPATVPAARSPVSKPPGTTGSTGTPAPTGPAAAVPAPKPPVSRPPAATGSTGATAPPGTPGIAPTVKPPVSRPPAATGSTGTNAPTGPTISAPKPVAPRPAVPAPVAVPQP